MHVSQDIGTTQFKGWGVTRRTRVVHIYRLYPHSLVNNREEATIWIFKVHGWNAIGVINNENPQRDNLVVPFEFPCYCTTGESCLCAGALQTEQSEEERDPKR